MGKGPADEREKDPLRIERYGEPIDLQGLWAPCPAFLVGSGPSVNRLPLEWLRERGIMSMAVNNTAARVPARAWTFGDPQSKFHQALYLDPAVMTFAPAYKLRWSVICKTGPDRWQATRNTFGTRTQLQAGGAVQQTEHFPIAQFIDQLAALVGRAKHDDAAQILRMVILQPVAQQDTPHRMRDNVDGVISARRKRLGYGPVGQFRNRIES